MKGQDPELRPCLSHMIGVSKERQQNEDVEAIKKAGFPVVSADMGLTSDRRVWVSVDRNGTQEKCVLKLTRVVKNCLLVKDFLAYNRRELATTDDDMLSVQQQREANNDIQETAKATMGSCAQRADALQNVLRTKLGRESEELEIEETAGEEGSAEGDELSEKICDKLPQGARQGLSDKDLIDIAAEMEEAKRVDEDNDEGLSDDYQDGFADDYQDGKTWKTVPGKDD